MQDRPNHQELLRGITSFLESEIVPVLEEPLRFHTRVAANLLKIIERELDLEEVHLNLEAQGLGKLLSSSSPLKKTNINLREEVRELNQALCLRIRQGEADHSPWGKEVLGHLKETVIQKLEIANPRMISKALTKY